MEKLQIRIPCSKISEFCGGNKFTTQQNSFFNVYKKNNSEEYKKILKKLKHEDKNEQNKNLLKEISVYKEITNAIKQGDNKTKNITLKLVEKKLKSKLEEKQIPKDQQKIIIQNVKKQADFTMKTEIGTTKENINLNKFENENNVQITSRNDETFTDYIKSEHVNLKMCGKIDGINQESGTLIEHKQRINRLFDTIPMYEMMQLFLYMNFTGCQKAILIQTFGNEQNSMEIEWSDEYWDILVNKIHKSLELYYTIVTDSKKLERLVKKFTVKKITDQSVRTLDNFFNLN